ncbi:MAG: S-layer homology domain-containing protein [Candidatus Limnocylindrales bacterium]
MSEPQENRALEALIDEMERQHEARIAELAGHHEARFAELERQLAAQTGRRLPRPRVSRLVVAFGLTLALLLPGIALASHRFTDVPNSNQFHNDIDWLADYGITTGYGDGTFKPGQAVTRQAMAAFMHRLSNQFEVVNSGVDPVAGQTFFHFAACPGDKRALSGGGFALSTAGNTLASDLFITASFPSDTSWEVDWETDNNATVDPSYLSVFVLCAPRF